MFTMPPHVWIWTFIDWIGFSTSSCMLCMLEWNVMWMSTKISPALFKTHSNVLLLSPALSKTNGSPCLYLWDYCHIAVYGVSVHHVGTLKWFTDKPHQMFLIAIHDVVFCMYKPIIDGNRRSVGEYKILWVQVINETEIDGFSWVLSRGVDLVEGASGGRGLCRGCALTQLTQLSYLNHKWFKSSVQCLFSFFFFFKLW